MQKKTKSLILSILIPLAVGGLAALLTRGSMAEFQNLRQPPLSPPPILFPIVWTILYVLMGISAHLAAWDANKPTQQWVLRLYAVQLGMNFLWPIFFFNLEWRLFSFFWLLMLIVLVARMAVQFYKIRPAAGLLQIPYLVWCCFAAYLNFGVYFLNR